MKKVFTRGFEVIMTLQNGGTISYTSDGIGGRACYIYDELPNEETVIIDNPDDVWDYLLTKCHFVERKTLFSKKPYIDYNGKKIYKGEIVSRSERYFPIIVENPKIEYLQKDLGFYGYSQLVFDREQELKEMLK